MTKTKIEWADRVWNPVTGCTKVSEGCRNCYAERQAKRFWGERKFTDVQCHPERLEQPLHWRKPSKIFVNSMGDLFHEDVSFEFIKKVWDITSSRLDHSFQILTKRPKRMLEFSQWMAGSDDISIAEWPRNVWLITSVEDQASADLRIPYLLQTPAAVRGVSCEPLLGAINIKPYLYGWYSDPRPVEKDPGIDWVICGGESGSGARPMHPDWARSLRDQCQEAGVPFFFKQWGEWTPIYPGVKRGGGLTNRPQYYPMEHLNIDGSIFNTNDSISFMLPKRCVAVYRCRLRAAGRLLDGQEWNEFPKQFNIGKEK